MAKFDIDMNNPHTALEGAAASPAEGGWRIVSTATLSNNPTQQLPDGHGTPLDAGSVLVVARRRCRVHVNVGAAGLMWHCSCLAVTQDAAHERAKSPMPGAATLKGEAGLSGPSNAAAEAARGPHSATLPWMQGRT